VLSYDSWWVCAKLRQLVEQCLILLTPGQLVSPGSDLVEFREWEARLSTGGTSRCRVQNIFEYQFYRVRKDLNLQPSR
jgi:hypothetical protein